MNDGYIKLKILDHLLVLQSPLPTSLIKEYAGDCKEKLDELMNFIDTLETIDTPLTTKEISELTGLAKNEIADIESEGITNLTKAYK